MIEQHVKAEGKLGLISQAHVLMLIFVKITGQRRLILILDKTVFTHIKYTGNMNYIFNTETLTQEAQDLVG